LIGWLVGWLVGWLAGWIGNQIVTLSACSRAQRKTNEAIVSVNVVITLKFRLLLSLFNNSGGDTRKPATLNENCRRSHTPTRVDKGNGGGEGRKLMDGTDGTDGRTDYGDDGDDD
jgi:hypothetical protein